MDFSLKLNKINIGLEWEPQISIPSIGQYTIYFKTGFREDEIKYEVFDKKHHLRNAAPDLPTDIDLIERKIIFSLPKNIYENYIDVCVSNFEIRSEPCKFYELDNAIKESYTSFIKIFEEICCQTKLEMGLFLPNTYLNDSKLCFKHLNISNFSLEYLDYIVNYVNTCSDINKSLFFKKMILIKNDIIQKGYTFIISSMNNHNIANYSNHCRNNPFSEKIKHNSRLHIKIPYDFTKYELIEYPNIFLDHLYDLSLNKKSEQTFLGYTNMGKFIKLRELI